MCLTAVLAFLAPSAIFAQSFHGASIQKDPRGPDGSNRAHVGDKVRTSIRVLNIDDFEDSLTITNIFDVTHHFSGDETSPNLLTNNVILPVFGSFKIVTYTNFVLPGDEKLTNNVTGRPVLTDDAMVGGIDNRDGLQGGVPDNFFLTFPGQLVVLRPCISVTEQCRYIGNSTQALVAYFGVVTNCGDAVLTNVMVTDSHGIMNFLGTLGVAGNTSGIPSSLTYSNVYLAVTNVSSNSVIAKGIDPLGTNSIFSTVMSTANCTVAVTPCIQVSEQCKYIGTSNQALVAYFGVVTNCGNVVLTNVMVTDSHGIMNLVGTLDFAGSGTGIPSSATYSNVYLATTNVSSNTVIAKGSTPIGTNLIFSTVMSTANCQVAVTPCILVSEQCRLIGTPDFPLVAYYGVVTNCGNVILTNVMVTDSHGIMNQIGILDFAGGGSGFPVSVTYSNVYLATATPSTNAVVAKGTSPIGDLLIFSTVTSTANCQVEIPCRPAIVLTKSADFPCAGTNITVSGSVSNSGNITLVNVMVRNDQPAPNTQVAGPLTLAPGQSVNFTTIYLTGESNCSIADTFTASGDYISVCSNGTVAVVMPALFPVNCECRKTPPCISVVKEVTLIPFGCVTNNGSSSGSSGGHSSSGNGGQSTGGNGGHSAVNDLGHSVGGNDGHSLIDDGGNTGHSGDANGGNGHSSDGSGSHSNTTNDCACSTSSRTFSKSSSGGKPLDDSLCPSFSYRFTVSNCSDSVTLTNVTLVDNKLDLSGYVFPNLAPLQSFTFDVGPVAHCSTETNVVTATGQSLDSGELATASDFAIALVQQSALVCSKIVSSVDAVITPESNEHYLVLPNDGQKHQVIFSVDVSNVGEGDLSNIKISDPLLKKYSCPVPAPFFLAAGTTTNITLCILALDCKDLPLKNKVTVSGTSDIIPVAVADPCADKAKTSHAGGGSHGNGHSGDGHSNVDTTPVGVTVQSTCEATVACTPPTHSHSSGSGKTSSSSTFPHSRFTTHSGQVAGPVTHEAHLDPQSTNIKGSWTHTRAMQGGKTGKFTSKSFDSYMVASSAGTAWNVGTLSYPGVNKVSFTGLGEYALNKGRRTPSTVLFRVDLEDRSEPKSAKDKSASSDRLRTRIWILTAAELTQLNNPSDGLLGMRSSIAASLGNTGTADGAVEADGKTPVPLGTAVFGVRAPDIDDGGSLQIGNDQIRPSAK